MQVDKMASAEMERILSKLADDYRELRLTPGQYIDGVISTLINNHPSPQFGGDLATYLQKDLEARIERALRPLVAQLLQRKVTITF